jgi:hypothetical protein
MRRSQIGVAGVVVGAIAAVIVAQAIRARPTPTNPSPTVQTTQAPALSRPPTASGNVP